MMPLHTVDLVLRSISSQYPTRLEDRVDFTTYLHVLFLDSSVGRARGYMLHRYTLDFEPQCADTDAGWGC